MGASGLAVQPGEGCSQNISLEFGFFCHALKHRANSNKSHQDNSAIAAVLAAQKKPPSNNWLLDANDDTERFRRLQVVMSGTDIPMWEITYRYEELYTAIQKNNWEMGVYHWDKLRDRMNAAAMKRPGRTQNIEGMFLESGVWQSMRDALTSKSPERMRSEFQTVREVCMACHVAENVGFLNDSSAFKRTKSFPKLDKDD